MGAGASSLPRLRKALLIKAYNTRRCAELSLYEQFLPFAVQRAEDRMYYITVPRIKECLGLDVKDYAWLDELLAVMFRDKNNDDSNADSEGETGRDREIYLYDFVQFLETGKVPSYSSKEEMFSNNTSTRNLPGPELKKKSSSSFNSSATSRSNSAGRLRGSSKERDSQRTASQPPPQPPRCNDAGGRSSVPSSRPRSAETKCAEDVRQESKGGCAPQEQEEEEEVISIDLSRIPSSATTIRLAREREREERESKSHNQEKEEEETLEIIIRPGKQTLSSSSLTMSGKQLWRKREVVRQEKTIHYTTVDEEGQQQELVEKETTQTEVLHMECRDTGEFAHRELTHYEQVETFNEEVVNEVRGNEEYVHLKSLEDEFHYMDSNMPPREREDAGGSGGGGEGERGERAEGEGEGEGEREGEHKPRYYYDPNEVPPTEEELREREAFLEAERERLCAKEREYYAERGREGEACEPTAGNEETAQSAKYYKDRSYLFDPPSPVRPTRPEFDSENAQEDDAERMEERRRGREENELNFSFNAQVDESQLREDEQLEPPSFILPSNAPAPEAPEPVVVEEEVTGRLSNVPSDAPAISRAESYQSMHDID